MDFPYPVPLTAGRKAAIGLPFRLALFVTDFACSTI
jgi:hypothetical protein